MELTAMENTEKNEKLVSIIIPVYNAEKYLGYCLNSVTSQTYRNLEIILSNDGSSDCSLEICENYAAIDERISVISIKNSGVSTARNTGLDSAAGQYIQFVDSDDVIRRDMVENLVGLMEMYETDAAVCGFEMVTLGTSASERECTVFTSSIMGSECVLPRDMFFEKMAFILWRTTYLESSCNKIFRREIIEENHLRFPREISLGEDFCFNMEYFEHIKGITFTNIRYYYYLQVKQEALTKRYRADLFENQMFLIQKFHRLLTGHLTMSEDEEKELAEYTVAKMMQSLYGLTNQECRLNIWEKKKEIAKIINNDYVRQAYKKAKYIEPRFEWIRECMEFSDVQKIYDFLFCEDIARETDEPAAQPAFRKPWWLKQLLIDFCDIILKVHNFQTIELIRNSLKVRSIKKTAKKCFLKLIGKSAAYDKIGIF